MIISSALVPFAYHSHDLLRNLV